MSNPKLNFALAVALVLAGAAQAFGQTVPPATPEQVDKLIAVLQSDAPQKEKVDACRQLSVIGTKDAVAPLAALLGDEQLSHMARYGLEPIPDPSVDQALRDALGRLNGRLLVGVIGSIGVRRDAAATDPLTKLLSDADPDVAQAAARALGQIGSKAAASAIQAALPGVPTASQLAFYEGLFRCAEAMSAKDQPQEASVLYDQLLKAQTAPHQVRAAAVRGAILARGHDDVTLLRQMLRSPDYILFAAGVRTSMEMNGAPITEALTAELDQLSPDNQVVVLQALGLRGDAGALPALTARAKSGPQSVRVAALKAIPMVGAASASPVLVELVDAAENEIAQAAQESLAALPGKEVDATVMAMLRSSESARRLIAIELIGRRRMLSAVPALQKAATDTDAKVRPAALKRLGELGNVAELPSLLDLLMQAKGADLDAAEQAVSAVCGKADDPESCSGKITGLYAQAGPAQKGALLRVLSTIGGANALTAVRTALKDSNADVRAAAIRALGDWKTADAAPDLLDLAANAGNPTEKMLSLRGYLGLAGNADLPLEQRLTMCRRAAELIRRAEEKKLLLAALGTIPSTDALALIMPYFDDMSTRDEASAAIVAVADKLLKGQSPGRYASQLIEPLQKVAQGSTNAELSRRARTLGQQAQRRAGGR
jgi:HEAT repeat protein